MARRVSIGVPDPTAALEAAKAVSEFMSSLGIRPSMDMGCAGSHQHGQLWRGKAPWELNVYWSTKCSRPHRGDCYSGCKILDRPSAVSFTVDYRTEGGGSPYGGDHHWIFGPEGLKVPKSPGIFPADRTSHKEVGCWCTLVPGGQEMPGDPVVNFGRAWEMLVAEMARQFRSRHVQQERAAREILDRLTA